MSGVHQFKTLCLDLCMGGLNQLHVVYSGTTSNLDALGTEESVLISEVS